MAEISCPSEGKPSAALSCGVNDSSGARTRRSYRVINEFIED